MVWKGPFNNLTQTHDLNAELVCNLDPHCIQMFSIFGCLVWGSPLYFFRAKSTFKEPVFILWVSCNASLVFFYQYFCHVAHRLLWQRRTKSFTSRLLSLSFCLERWQLDPVCPLVRPAFGKAFYAFTIRIICLFQALYCF